MSTPAHLWFTDENNAPVLDKVSRVRTWKKSKSDMNQLNGNIAMAI